MFFLWCRGAIECSTTSAKTAKHQVEVAREDSDDEQGIATTAFEGVQKKLRITAAQNSEEDAHLTLTLAMELFE